MAEIQPIGLPNLISQSDLIIRTRAAQSGADRTTQDVLALALNRSQDRRREQVQRVPQIGATSRRRRDRDARAGRDDPHDRYDDGDDDTDDADGHQLDLSA